MNPHPNMRKTVKWTGTVLSLVLGVVWIASAWVWGEWWIINGGVLIVAKGRVGLAQADGLGRASDRFSWGVLPQPREWLWRFENTKDLPWTTTRIPLWALAAPLVLVTSAAWTLDMLARRRVVAGFCGACGYDLSATPAQAKCPECGTAASHPPARSL